MLTIGLKTMHAIIEGDRLIEKSIKGANVLILMIHINHKKTQFARLYKIKQQYYETTVKSRLLSVVNGQNTEEYQKTK